MIRIPEWKMKQYGCYCAECRNYFGYGFGAYSKPQCQIYALDLAYGATHSSDFMMKFFCDEKCRDKYLKRHLIEEYKGNSIYYFNGGFVLYPSASYGFCCVDDCKEFIDSTTKKLVATVSKAEFTLALRRYV